MENLHEDLDEILGSLRRQTKDLILGSMPEKLLKPYICFCNDANSFYVSTTDQEEFNGYITMQEITKLFIENKEHGIGGSIDHKDAEPFLNELKKAIKQIESRVETKNPRVNP